VLADTGKYEILSVFTIAGKPTVDSNTYARENRLLIFWGNSPYDGLHTIQ